MIAYQFLAFLAVYLAVQVLAESSSEQCGNVYPHLSCGLNYQDEDSCTKVGCCWLADEVNGRNCFAPRIYGYEFKEESSDGGVKKGSLNLNQASGISFGADYKELAIEVTQETASRTHIKIAPTGDEKRWEIPESVLPRPGGIYKGHSPMTKTIIKAQNDDDSYDNMEILITRLKHGIPTPDVIFLFTKMLVFQDQYIQFVLGTPPSIKATFGFGESSRLSQQLQYNNTYTLWNTDWLAAGFDAELYGSHPFYLQVTEDGQAHGMLFMNSNAMDMSMTSSSDQGNTIGIQSTGGLVDIYVFAGPTPADVVAQYLEVVGRPALVPYWSLGFHNCRWGYEDIQYVADVVTNYSAAQIPLETQWVDIDYMHKYWDFTLDEDNFPQTEMTKFVDQLHKNNQYFVPIVDPAIYMRDASYPTYQEGMELDVFVKDLQGKAPYMSQVWPGPTYFPDWFATNTQTFWTNQMKQFYTLVAYDGIWIDMNEASNFCNMGGSDQVCELIEENPCASNECCLKCSTVDAENMYDFPPFVPNVQYKTLGGKTVAMSALHATDADQPAEQAPIREYNAHNLYGLMEAMATRAALLEVKPQVRPFVLSRSTTMGSGQYTTHWTGDNAATWDDLKVSIITMNNLALFGLSVTGADICGFMGDTTEELCARWIEVGAFSPFSRNHNSLGQAPQELYRWDSVTEASRSVLSLRYRLLPHLYTLLYQAHTQGALVMNGMWVNFPADGETLTKEGQYMWSDSLLFTPVLEEGATSVEGYFPNALWYPLMGDSEQLIDATAAANGGGVTVDLPTSLTSTNVHVRGGSVVPMQDAAMTTADAKKTPFTLLVALDSDSQADGELYLDDGVQEQLTNSTLVSFNVRDSTLTSKLSLNTFATGATIGQVEILGVSISNGAACDAKIIASSTEAAASVTSSQYTSKSGYDALVISLANLHVASEFQLSWKCN